MPIYTIPGLTSTHTDDETSVVEVGRIRKGEKVKGKGGVERPVNLDYFKVVIRDDLGELQALFDRQVFDRPKKLRIQLAYPDLERSWWAWNSIYKSGGMLGLNDGVWWNYLRDPNTNEILVRDYMLTPNALQIMDENGCINGHPTMSARDALVDYQTNYHIAETPLPRGWRNVEIALSRKLDPVALLVNAAIPVYTTGEGNKYREYFADPEGRLFVTMPHLEGFTSSLLFQFNTGSSHDIRTISKNLNQVALQASLFDSDQGRIALDAIPLQMVRRKEIISKMINDKPTKGPEWLVHIETLPQWQNFVDDLQLRINVQRMYAAVAPQLEGLSQTVDKLELPEIRPPLDDNLLESGDEAESGGEADVMEGEVVETQPEPEPETEPEPKPEPKKPARKPKLKPREISSDAKAESYSVGTGLLESDEEIGASEFWGVVYGLGYDQKSAEPFLTSADWKACLRLALDDYDKHKTTG